MDEEQNKKRLLEKGRSKLREFQAKRRATEQQIQQQSQHQAQQDEQEKYMLQLEIEEAEQLLAKQQLYAQQRAEIEYQTLQQHYEQLQVHQVSQQPEQQQEAKVMPNARLLAPQVSQQQQQQAEVLQNTQHQTQPAMQVSQQSQQPTQSQYAYHQAQQESQQNVAQYTLQLSQAYDTIRALTNERDQGVQINEASQREIRAREMQIERQIEAQANLFEENSRLKEELDECVLIKRQDQIRLHAYELRQAEMEAANSDLKHHIGVMQNEINAASSTISTTASAISPAPPTSEPLHDHLAEIVELKAELARVRQREQEMQLKLGMSEETITTLNDGLRHMVEVKEQNAAYMESTSSARERAETLLVAEREKHASNMVEIARLRTRVSELESDHENMNVDMDVNLEGVGNENNDTDNTLRESIQTHEQILLESTSTARDLAGANLAPERELRAMENAQIAEYRIQIAEDLKQMTKDKEIIASLSTRLNELEFLLGEAKDDGNTAAEGVDNLREGNTEMDKETIGSLEARISELQSQLEIANANNLNIAGVYGMGEEIPDTTEFSKTSAQDKGVIESLRARVTELESQLWEAHGHSTVLGDVENVSETKQRASEGETNQLIEDMKCKNSTIARLQTEVGTLEDKMASLGQEREHEKDENVQLANERDRLLSNIAALQTTVGTREAEIQKLVGMCDRNDELISSLHVQISEMRDTVISLEGERTRMTEQVCSLHATIETLKETAASALGDSTTPHSDANSHMTEVVIDDVNDVPSHTSINTEGNGFLGQIHVMKLEITELLLSFERLQEVAKDTTAQRDEYANTIVYLETQIREMQSQIQTQKRQITMNNMNDTNIAQDSAVGASVGVDESINESGTDVDVLEAEKDALKAELAHTHQQLAMSQSANEALQSDLSSAMRDRERETTNNTMAQNAAQSRMSELQAEMEELDKGRLRIVSDLDEKTAELASSVQERAKLETDLVNIQTDFDTVKNEHACVEAEMELLRVEKTDLATDVEHLKSEVNSVKAELANVKAGINSALHLENEMLKSELNTVQADLFNTNSELELAKNSLLNAEEEKMSVKTDLEVVPTTSGDGAKNELEIELARVLGDAQEKAMALNVCIAEKKTLESKLLVVQSEITDLEVLITHVQTELEDVKRQMARRDELRLDMQNDLQQPEGKQVSTSNENPLEHELARVKANAKAQAISMKTKYANLEAELAKLNAKLDDNSRNEVSNDELKSISNEFEDNGLSNLVMALQADKESLLGELKHARNERDEKIAALMQLQAHVDHEQEEQDMVLVVLNNEKYKLFQDCKKLKKEKTDIEAEKASLETKVKELELEIHRLNHITNAPHYQQLEANLVMLQDDVDDFQQQIAQRDDKLRALQMECYKAQDIANDLRIELAKEKNTKINTDANEMLQQLTGQISQKSKEIETLHARLEETQSEVLVGEETISVLEGKIEHLEEERRDIDIVERARVEKIEVLKENGLVIKADLELLLGLAEAT
eukprot:CFRG3980T1